MRATVRVLAAASLAGSLTAGSSDGNANTPSPALPCRSRRTHSPLHHRALTNRHARRPPAALGERRQLQGNFICADFDDNGIISVADLLLLLGMFGGMTASTPAVGPYDLSNNGIIDVSDLLLLLGSFGGQCTRAPVVAAAPTWFDENANPDALGTWGKAVDYCFAQGMELCSCVFSFKTIKILPWKFKILLWKMTILSLKIMILSTVDAEYCPNGGGAPPEGGVKGGDEWAPMADEPNRWVRLFILNAMFFAAEMTSYADKMTMVSG